jgi:hypothetical protein
VGNTKEQLIFPPAAGKIREGAVGGRGVIWVSGGKNLWGGRGGEGVSPHE